MCWCLDLAIARIDLRQNIHGYPTWQSSCEAVLDEEVTVLRNLSRLIVSASSRTPRLKSADRSIVESRVTSTLKSEITQKKKEKKSSNRSLRSPARLWLLSKQYMQPNCHSLHLYPIFKRYVHKLFTQSWLLSCIRKHILNITFLPTAATNFW